MKPADPPGWYLFYLLATNLFWDTCSDDVGLTRSSYDGLIGFLVRYTNNVKSVSGRVDDKVRAGDTEVLNSRSERREQRSRRRQGGMCCLHLVRMSTPKKSQARESRWIL